MFASVILGLGGTGVLALLSAVAGIWPLFQGLFSWRSPRPPATWPHPGGSPAGRQAPWRPQVREHVVPDLTIGMIANTLAQVTGGATGKAILDAPHDVIQEGVIQGEAQVFRCVLPGAAAAAGLVQHEQRVAAGLGRPVDCAIVDLLPAVSASHFDLWVLDKQALGGKPRPGPLASAKRTNWWGRVDLGRTRTGQHHTERLHGGSYFVGGKPESGKSTLAIIAAAHTALDPFAHLVVVNLKGSPDYAALRRIAASTSRTPESNRRIIREVHALVEWLLDETGRRNDLLTRLVEKGEATGNAVTEELSRKYPQLRPMTVILDEIHRMFDEGDNPDWEGFAALLAKVLKACRSAGITVICVTQLAGTESIPGVCTKAARVRACLRVGEASSMRQILGDLGPGAFERFGLGGFPSGTAMLTTDDGSPMKIGGWYLADHLASIGERAEALRTASICSTVRPPELRSTPVRQSTPPTSWSTSSRSSSRPSRQGAHRTPTRHGWPTWRSDSPNTRSTVSGRRDGCSVNSGPGACGRSMSGGAAATRTGPPGSARRSASPCSRSGSTRRDARRRCLTRRPSPDRPPTPDRSGSIRWQSPTPTGRGRPRQDRPPPSGRDRPDPIGDRPHRPGPDPLPTPRPGPVALPKQ